METESLPLEMLRQLRTAYREALHNFANSAATFRILRSVPQSSGEQNQSSSLYVLDSSFNPPSKAHRLIARNAVLRDDGPNPKRLLLLLATENADKRPKPADFEDRLVMMTLMAQDIWSAFQTDGSHFPDVSVDVGVTKKPFFMDKASSIDQSQVYGPETQQIHISGYDTAIRIFDPKYYPADKKLAVLEPFLRKHRLRVCYRLDEKHISRREQEDYVEKIGDGSREGEGMKKEWRTRIELVDDAKGEGEGVSSTNARKAVASERWTELRDMVGKEVGEYIEKESLYRDSSGRM